MFASSPVKAWLRRWRYFVVEARSNLINGRVRVAVDFLAWVRRRRESISAAICDRGATQPKSISDAIRRTRALCGVWQRCSLLTDPCRYAHRSFLASHHKLLLRGLLLFMRCLLGPFSRLRRSNPYLPAHCPHRSALKEAAPCPLRI